MGHRFILVALAAFIPNSAAAWWQIRTSDHECLAVYRTGTGASVVLLENDETRRARESIGEIERDAPVLQWFFPEGQFRDDLDPSELEDILTTEDDNYHSSTLGTAEVEIRLFPDDGQGFFDAVVSVGTAQRINTSGYGTDYVLQWTDFDLHDRFKSWGMAKETKDDPGVRVPEVRLILKYEVKEDAWGEDDEGYRIRTGTTDVTVHLDIPMWRTSNVMNKLERCSEALIEG